VLLVAGNLVYDWIGGPVEGLTFDTTVWPSHFGAGLGGNGAVTAYAAAYLGAAVRLVTAYGADGHGELCRKRLESAGVECVTPEPPSGETALTMGVFNASGARALLHRPGVLTHALSTVESLRPSASPGTTWLHVANPFNIEALRRSAPRYLREACEDGWTTSLDTGWDRQGEWLTVIGPCLPYLEWLFANEAEARLLTGAADLETAIRQLQNAGASNVVVKCGAAGCLLAEGRSATVAVPAHPVDAVDTTGAGDCFCGGFLAAMLRELDPVEAARIANVCGALSATQAGGTGGLRTWREIQRLAGL